MKVADFKADVAQVVGKVLGGPLRQGGHEHSLAFLDALAAQLDGVIDLVFQRLEQ